MKIAMLVAGFTLAAAAIPAQAATFGFDDLGDTTVLVPAGYQGLDWTNVFSTNGADTAAAQGGPGYANGVISASNIAFNGFGELGTFASATPFLFNSAYVTAAFSEGLTVTFTGFAGATALYSDTFAINTTSPVLRTFDWADVTSVTFIASLGQPGGQVVLDNLTINAVAAGVPEPASWALMIAGIGGIGGALRRRQKVRVSYAV